MVCFVCNQLKHDPNMCQPNNAPTRAEEGSKRGRERERHTQTENAVIVMHAVRNKLEGACACTTLSILATRRQFWPGCKIPRPHTKCVCVCFMHLLQKKERPPRKFTYINSTVCARESPRADCTIQFARMRVHQIHYTHTHTLHKTFTVVVA